MKFVFTITSERCFGFSPCQHLFSQARHIGLPGRHLWDISGHEKFNADADCKQNIYGLIQATNWEVLRLKFFKRSRHTLMNFSIAWRLDSQKSSQLYWMWSEVACQSTRLLKGAVRPRPTMIWSSSLGPSLLHASQPAKECTFILPASKGDWSPYP